MAFVVRTYILGLPGLLWISIFCAMVPTRALRYARPGDLVLHLENMPHFHSPDNYQKMSCGGKDFKLSLRFSVCDMTGIQNMEEPGKSWARCKWWHLASSFWQGGAFKCCHDLRGRGGLWPSDVFTPALPSLQQFQWSGDAAVEPTAHLANSDIYWKHDGPWKEDCFISILSICAGLGGTGWEGRHAKRQGPMQTGRAPPHPPDLSALPAQCPGQFQCQSPAPAQCRGQLSHHSLFLLIAAWGKEEWVVLATFFAACKEMNLSEQGVTKWQSCQFVQADARINVAGKNKIKSGWNLHSYTSQYFSPSSQETHYPRLRKQADQ